MEKTISGGAVFSEPKARILALKAVGLRLRDVKEVRVWILAIVPVPAKL
jgi:hypothetical protein